MLTMLSVRVSQTPYLSSSGPCEREPQSARSLSAMPIYGDMAATHLHHDLVVAEQEAKPEKD
jgi:hypothetical protein